MLKAPFPWFGGKSRAAHLVWERFGDVPNYVEPFFGSGATLLLRPTQPGIETVNDLDCMVSNFWRALQHDPDAVASHADNPVNEADQHARHRWLCSQEEFRERMKVDPDYYDAKIAGWWVWGQSIWIGGGWCEKRIASRQLPSMGDAGTGIRRRRPSLRSGGAGIHRQLPSPGNAGAGIHRQLPSLGNAGVGIHRQLPSLGSAGVGIQAYMQEIADRLRRVRVCCGDWSRVLGPSPTFKLGVTGVFLDPPYSSEAGRDESLYAEESLTVARDVRAWAIANGDNPMLRIALCGYEGEHEMPDTWECVPWKAGGGYGSQGNGAGRENAARERIWFSPHCLTGQQSLFAS